MTAHDIFPYRDLPKVCVPYCPVCQQTAYQVQLERDRYGYRVPFIRCGQCGLGYLAEQLTREGYDRFYAHAYRALVAFYTGRTRDDLAIALSHSQSSRGAFLAVMLPRWGCQARRLLDAGGSRGGVGAAIAGKIGAASVTVLDPAPDELPEGHLRGYLEDPIPGRYDGVICCETMDHVTDPVRVLRNLRTACPGWLYADLVTKGDLKIDHPFYWTPESFRRALDQAGWTVAKGFYLNGCRSRWGCLAR